MAHRKLGFLSVGGPWQQKLAGRGYVTHPDEVIACFLGIARSTNGPPGISHATSLGAVGCQPARINGSSGKVKWKTQRPPMHIIAQSCIHPRVENYRVYIAVRYLQVPSAR